MKFALVFNRRTILQDRNERFQGTFVFESLSVLNNKRMRFQFRRARDRKRTVGFCKQQRIVETAVAQVQLVFLSSKDA